MTHLFIPPDGALQFHVTCDAYYSGKDVSDKGFTVWVRRTSQGICRKCGTSFYAVPCPPLYCQGILCLCEGRIIE